MDSPETMLSLIFDKTTGSKKFNVFLFQHSIESFQPCPGLFTLTMSSFVE